MPSTWRQQLPCRTNWQRLSHFHRPTADSWAPRRLRASRFLDAVAGAWYSPITHGDPAADERHGSDDPTLDGVFPHACDRWRTGRRSPQLKRTPEEPHRPVTSRRACFFIRRRSAGESARKERDAGRKTCQIEGIGADRRRARLRVGQRPGGYAVSDGALPVVARRRAELPGRGGQAEHVRRVTLRHRDDGRRPHRHLRAASRPAGGPQGDARDHDRR